VTFFENGIVVTPNNRKLKHVFFIIGLPRKFISTGSKNTCDSEFNRKPFNSIGGELEE
jgi:hypothetical protein